MIYLTWDGVGESVGVFGYECVLDVSSSHSMGTWERHTQLAGEVTYGGRRIPHVLLLHLLQNLPNKTSVFLLKAGSFTTSSYVTRSSWSNTGSDREGERVRGCWDKQQLEGSTEWRVGTRWTKES